MRRVTVVAGETINRTTVVSATCGIFTKNITPPKRRLTNAQDEVLPILVASLFKALEDSK